MGKGKLTIVGEPPGLLMKTPEHMIIDAGSNSSGGKTTGMPSLEEQAALSRYLMPGSEDQLCIWGEHIRGALIGVASNYKVKVPKAKSLVPFLSGLVQIEPAFIPLGTTEYEVDIRSVVNKTAGRVVVGRARVFPWQVTVDVLYDDFLAQFMEKTFEELVNDAGRMRGICAYRPQKRGPFGRFYCSRWEILELTKLEAA